MKGFSLIPFISWNSRGAGVLMEAVVLNNERELLKGFRALAVRKELQEATSGCVRAVIRDALQDSIHGLKRVDFGPYPVQMRPRQPAPVNGRTLPIVGQI
jgi:hypothetical protein